MPIDRDKAAKAFDARLKQGWTPIDESDRGFWFFPSERRLWQETNAWKPSPEAESADRAVLLAHPDAIHLLQSGCPQCLTGYADIMSDPMYHCDLCDGTGFPVFGEERKPK